mmetsp:Transcript_24808/g.62273  ORF Transcript_24808/g.62273 Transcript_24808/m.62273 type:complete len:507 (-) Transcript_24808:68-1588(-)|eukprot:CAMPEP_0174240548 /NCGR_PEP_ID=MMETSP0417-20130205/19288_1 /TAXON_ID=242541 /ORGANISM="Mayorella sp, Strain BSH-02190019" /LENGTH=506 /DNA_ID=CAMNT_0015319651 /DNA_START=143 /DNA_END=1663 /DNA_ORIENTATION=+
MFTERVDDDPAFVGSYEDEFGVRTAHGSSIQYGAPYDDDQSDGDDSDRQRDGDLEDREDTLGYQYSKQRRLVPDGDDDEAEPGSSSWSGPEDSYQAVWFVCLLQGIGLLYPWNAWITPTDYWDILYGSSFEFYLSLAYNYPAILTLLLNVKFGPKFTFQSRIITGFAVNFVVLSMVPVITSLDISTTLSMWLVLGGVFISGTFSAMLFGSVMGLGSIFPPKYVGAVMSGNGVAGILAGAIRIITKLALPDDLKGSQTASIIYFALGSVIMLVCVFSYHIMRMFPYARYHLDKSSEASALIEIADDGSYLENPLPAAKPISVDNSLSIKMILKVFGKIKLEAFEVMFVFLVTLSLFPGITVTIPSNGFSQTWFSIIMIALFQVFDFVGRTVPRWKSAEIFSPKTLWIPVLSRLVFAFLFIICLNPRWITINAFPYLFMVLMAFSNGYVGTYAMMYGPGPVENDEKETAGLIMGLFLNLGIFLAVHVALLVAWLDTCVFPSVWVGCTV